MVTRVVVPRDYLLTKHTPLGSTTYNDGPVLSTPPKMVLMPNGRTEEYSVYACAYKATRSVIA